MKHITSRLSTLVLAALLAPMSSCLNDLDQTPSFVENTETVFKDPVKIKGAWARLYATLAVSGQQGPAGSPDIFGIDEGFSNYLRQYFKAQELTTDEAIIGWNDGNLPDYNKVTWNADNEFVRAMYDRIFYQISLCNEFIRQTTDAQLQKNGVTVTQDIKVYRAEARFLRALSYWHGIDMFGNVPFFTETNLVGSTPPPMGTRAQVFAYVESELKAIEGDLLAPRARYASADKATAWMLLAKLYLNAKVYTGTERNNDAAIYAKKVIDAGYTLAPDYKLLFLADNNSSAARNEIIFPVTFDGLRTKTFGGMTFLVHAPVGGSMKGSDFGINGGWYGLRAKKNLVDLFGAGDSRALFYTEGQSKEIADIFTFTDGYAVQKYRNITSTGEGGSDSQQKGGSGDFPDTDFPMFRLADAYLMYAEAVVRGGSAVGGLTADAAVNTVRARAGAADLAGVTLDDILAERGRELYWEGHRRTDLIRFNKYTKGYNWPFKGGSRDGQDVDDKFKLFPLPTTDLTLNPNLKQNPGY